MALKTKKVFALYQTHFQTPGNETFMVDVQFNLPFNGVNVAFLLCIFFAQKIIFRRDVTRGISFLTFSQK